MMLYRGEDMELHTPRAMMNPLKRRRQIMKKKETAAAVTGERPTVAQVLKAFIEICCRSRPVNKYKKNLHPTKKRHPQSCSSDSRL